MSQAARDYHGPACYSAWFWPKHVNAIESFGVPELFEFGADFDADAFEARHVLPVIDFGPGKIHRGDGRVLGVFADETALVLRGETGELVRVELSTSDVLERRSVEHEVGYRLFSTPRLGCAETGAAGVVLGGVLWGWCRRSLLVARPHEPIAFAEKPRMPPIFEDPSEIRWLVDESRESLLFCGGKNLLRCLSTSPELVIHAAEYDVWPEDACATERGAVWMIGHVPVRTGGREALCEVGADLTPRRMFCFPVTFRGNELLQVRELATEHACVLTTGGAFVACLAKRTLHCLARLPVGDWRHLSKHGETVWFSEWQGYRVASWTPPRDPWPCCAR